jgi:glutamate-1-semialdehyde aminotransferase/thioesterase domain-containing protein/acyl carrier protein
MANKQSEQVIQRVREIVLDLSGAEAESVSENMTFLELGFDSLFLTQLSTVCQKVFGLRVTFRQLFSDLPTIAALGSYLAEKLPSDHELVVSASGNEEDRPMSVETPVVNSAVPAQTVVATPVPPAFPVQVEVGADASFPVFALPSDMEAGAFAGMESLMLRQLALMDTQLRFLQGLPVQAAVTSPVATQTRPVPPVSAAPTIPQVAGAPSQATVPVEVQRAANQPEQGTPKPLAGFGPSAVGNTALQPLPARQQEHLDRLIASYTKKTAGSKERTQRYRRYHADPRTAAGFTRRWKEMVYPIWVQRSLGSKLWDVDGNEYIDLLNGFGPHFLGHAPEFVTNAVAEQLTRGFEIGPQTPLAGEVAEMICGLTGMDRASFTCTGSEAVQAAMRLSRTVTGRDKVVVFSRDYHGNFDQVLVREANRAGQLRTMPSAPGIPFQSVDDTFVMDYGTAESLELIRKHAGEIAAVVVEPVQSRRPDFQPREFLNELRRVTQEEGILLVFDEVVTGFRCAPGGAQAYFGVQADLATYGKVIGGGLPIGVVAGRSSVMDTFDGGFWQYGDESFPEAGVTFFAGTFVRHPLSIAAAHATLKYLIQEGPALQQRVAEKADQFAGCVNDLFRRYELDIELPHFTSQMYLRVKEYAELANLLAFHLRYRGVHILENFPCYMTESHTPADIEHLVGAFTESVEAMVEDGIFGNPSQLSKTSEKATQQQSPSAIGTRSPERPQPISAFAGPVEYPPTETQKGMWIAAQMRSEASAASNGTNVVELVGEINVLELERAIAEVVNRHEALRSTFNEDGSKVVVHPSGSLDLTVHDLSSLSSAEAAAQLTEILEEDGRQVFDLANGPLASFMLVKLEANKHLLVFTAQMIICDGWGFKVALEEISKLYSAFVARHEVSLDPPKQMREYAIWQTQEEGSASAKECESFWLAQYDTLPPHFDLPTSQPRSRTRTYEAARASLRLAPDFYKAFKLTARKQRNTPFALLLTAYATWLYRLSEIKDFVIGVPFAGQSARGLDTLVGQCVHTLPFRFQIDGNATFADQLARTQQLILDAQDHWNLDIGSLIQKLNVPNDPSRLPLVPLMFNLDPALSGVQFSGCSARITSGPRFYFHYDLGFNIVDEGETLLVECDYNTNLFDSHAIRRWIADFQNLLEGIVSNPSDKLAQLPMMATSEQDKAPANVMLHRNGYCATSRLAKNTESNEYIAPKSDTEKRLARLWCETLTLDKVSCTANFFDLGGHSLTAVSLFAKIEKEFGKRLALSTLFNSPTIQKLSVALQGRDKKEPWSPLVAIQPKGSKPPLFLVHGAGGNVLLYRSLGEQLAPDFPLYGFQSVGLDGESQPLQSIEEMAVAYIRELKKVQPRGPYYLGGYCLGGTVAYEMAQVLSGAGDEVRLVAMLDTYNFSLALKVRFSSFLMQKTRFHLANVVHLHPGSLVKYVREKVRLGVGGEWANLKTSMPGSSRSDGVSRAVGGVEGAIQAINDYAAEHYNPMPYAGKVTLFKPRFNYKFYPDPNLGWGDLVQGGLELIEVAVNPHSMLLEPYISILASQLKHCIADGLPKEKSAGRQDPAFAESVAESGSKNLIL